MPRRNKRSAWASIAQVDATTWRIRFWADGPDGYRRRSKTIRNATRKQAEAARAQLMLEHGEDAPCPTVGQAWERWALPGYVKLRDRGDMAPRTLSVYESVFGKHVLPRWGEVPLDQVRPLLVQQWLDGLGLSAAQKSLIVMKWTFDCAVRFGAVDANPMRERYILPSSATVERRDAGVWDEDSLGEVWRAVHGTFIEPAVLLMAFGSCRVAESLAPHGTDVELRWHAGVPCACVRISYQIDDRGHVYDRVKTEASARVVVVPGAPGLRLAELARACGDGPLTDDGAGGYVGKRRLRDSFRATLVDAGVPVHDLRSLRRTWRTIMRRRMRLPEWVAEPLMGHVPSDVTSRHYDVPDLDDFVRPVCEAYARFPYSEYPWAVGVCEEAAPTSPEDRTNRDAAS
jgi:hypothetical protein